MRTTTSYDDDVTPEMLADGIIMRVRNGRFHADTVVGRLDYGQQREGESGMKLYADGQVKYWSVLEQRWHCAMADALSDATLAAMTSLERELVRRGFLLAQWARTADSNFLWRYRRYSDSE